MQERISELTPTLHFAQPTSTAYDGDLTAAEPPHCGTFAHTETHQFIGPDTVFVKSRFLTPFVLLTPQHIATVPDFITLLGE